MKHLARLTVALLVAAGLPLLVSSPAQAAACTRGTGVTVVVDGNQLGGLSTTCVPGSGRSGTAAFQAAGVSIQRVATQPGFVCKVNGAPASQTCQRTPPATAYWSLWVSDGKGTWSYASRGVDSLSVPAGGWVAWSWQGQTARSAPSVTPQGPAPAKAPSKKTGSTSGATSGGGSTASSGSSGSTGGSAGRSAAGGSDGEPRATASPSSSRERAADGTKGGSKDGADDRAKDRSDDEQGAAAGSDGDGEAEAGRPDQAGSGSDAQVRPTASQVETGGGLGSWVAGLAILAVLVAAGATAWRRRPAS